MENLRIGIRNNNPKREEIVLRVFNSIKDIIKNKKEFLYNVQIDAYETLKNEFDKEDIDDFENNNKKAIAHFQEEIILFNDSFFNNTTKINKQAVFIHEIGHIINKPPQDGGNYLVKYVYGEYLADEYLFEIDKDIFLNGRIIPDLDIILVAQIRDEIENADNQEEMIKGKFCIIGRLYYYYLFCKYEPILPKIKELIVLIKKYYHDVDSILINLNKICNELQLKTYQELEFSFVETHNKIINLKRSLPNQPQPPIPSL